MHLGRRPRSLFPAFYKDYALIRTHGRVFGVPPHLDLDELRIRGTLYHHPAVLRAATPGELEALIDAQPPGRAGPEQVGSYCGYDLFRCDNTIYGVPQGIAALDLELPEDRQKAGVVAGQTPQEVRDRISASQERTPVEFTGWLPIVKSMGNCGQHPQFKHTATPPAGYRFTDSKPAEPRPSIFMRALVCVAVLIFGVLCALAVLVRPWFAVFRPAPRVSWRSRCRLLMAMFRLSLRMLRAGGGLFYVLNYIRSRNYPSQLLLAENRNLLFLTSVPYTVNQNPWVIEIEDPTTLFFPFIQNGNTCDLEIASSPYYPIVKAQLEDDRCKGIITHIRSTARMLPHLFRSDAIARKVFYAPLGVKIPGRWQRQEEAEPEHINLLFINSWHQQSSNLHVRGGLEVIEAFAILHERYPQIRLTLRTSLPELDDHYFRILESGWVRLINRFLSTEEMEQLHAESHIFLLPAARIHVVSLLQAMAAGLAVVTSDGWGIQEYVTHERNGLVVTGRYGKTSWADEEAGMLREDYQDTHTADPDIVNQIVEAVSRLIENPELRRRLGQTARHDVETQFNLQTWNEGLKAALDGAMGVERGSELVNLPETCGVLSEPEA